MPHRMISAPSYAAAAASPAAACALKNDEDAKQSHGQQRVLEIILIIITVALTTLLYRMQGYKMVILNLYFLPVVISGFFLGRYRACVLAVLSVLAASVVTVMNLTEMARVGSPLVMALVVAVWAAVLGLTAAFVGTLSDERSNRLKELHDAYVGVVEVLSQYLQGAHPRLKARSIRVAELSHNVAVRLKFSPREVDDIRVGALLYDVGNIEITTRVIRRAVETLDADTTARHESQTIQGTDLMLSLASVLNGAVPLLLNQEEERIQLEGGSTSDVPLGAKVIFAVRAYDALTEGAARGHRLAPGAAIRELRTSRASTYDPAVLSALERVVVHDAQGAQAVAAQENGDYDTQVIHG